MGFTLEFFIKSILLGVALAMDAFSVSVVNGFGDIKMKKRKGALIAGTFAFFQFIMPMVGWVFVHYLCEFFNVFEKFIPWIALGLLLFIGIKMIIDGIRGGEADEYKPLGFLTLIIQGIATSIDALSVGFTIEKYNLLMAFICSLIIAVVTFAICVFGLIIGKKVGTKLNNKASVLGGVILVIIGIWIFVKSFI